MISSGLAHSLYLTSKGLVYGSGSNFNSELGILDLQVSRPTLIPITNVSFISAGHSHSIFLTSTGVYAVGLNNFGQIGLGSSPRVTSITNIQPLVNIVFVASGFDNSFFIDSSRKVYVTGSNANGVFGTGDYVGSTTPFLLTNPLLNNVSSISVGLNHVLFLTSNNNLYSTGKNDFGQLGLGDMVDRNTLQFLSSDVLQVSSYNGSSFFMTKNQTLYSFGNNENGQLCLGDNLNRNFPVNVSPSIFKKVGASFSVGQSSYFLGCEDGYYGDECQFSTCFGIKQENISVCSSRGSCISKDVCSCLNGFYGVDCSQHTCFGINATSSNVCSSNGNCASKDNCTCNSGWTGKDCSIPTCFGVDSTSKSVCSGNGQCRIPNLCVCKNRFAGVNCQFTVSPNTFCFGVRATDSSVCSGTGACVGANRCICNTYDSGNNCEFHNFTWNPKNPTSRWTNSSSWMIKTDYGYIDIDRYPVSNDSLSFNLPGESQIILDVALNLPNITVGGEKSKYTLNIQANQNFSQELIILQNSKVIINQSNVTFNGTLRIEGETFLNNSTVIISNKLYKNTLISISKGSNLLINSDNASLDEMNIDGVCQIKTKVSSTLSKVNIKGFLSILSNITLSNTYINNTGILNFNVSEVRGNGLIYNYGDFQIITNKSTTTRISNNIKIYNYNTFEIEGGGVVSCSSFFQGSSSLFSLKGSTIILDSPLLISFGKFYVSGKIITPLLNITTPDLIRLYSDLPLSVNGSLYLSEETTTILEISRNLKNSERIIVEEDIILNGLLYIKLLNYNVELGDYFSFLSFKRMNIGRNMKLMLIGSAYKTAKLIYNHQIISNRNFKNTSDNIDSKNYAGLEIIVSIGNLQFQDFYNCHYLGNQRSIEVVHFKQNRKVALTFTTPSHHGWSAFGINFDRNLTNIKSIASQENEVYEIYNHTIRTDIMSFIDTSTFKSKSLFGIGKDYLSMTMFLDEDDLTFQKYIYYVQDGYDLMNSSFHFSDPIYEINLLDPTGFVPCTNFLSPNRVETHYPYLIGLLLGLYLLLFILLIIFHRSQPLLSRGLAPITSLFFLTIQLGMEIRNYEFIPSEQRSLCLYFAYSVYPLQQISFVIIIFYNIRYFSIISLNNIKNNLKIINIEGDIVLRYSWRIIILKHLSKLWFITFFMFLFVTFSIILNTVVLAAYPKFQCYFSTISSLKILNSSLMLIIFLIVLIVIIGDLLINYQQIIKCSFFKFIFKTDPYYFRLQILMFVPFMIYTLISEIYILFKIQTFIDIVQYNLVTEILNTINYNLLLFIEIIFPLFLTIFQLIWDCFKPVQNSNGLTCLLNDPKGYELFLEFAKKEYSIENVYSWKECTEFQQNFLKDKPKMVKFNKSPSKASTPNSKMTSPNILTPSLHSPRDSSFDIPSEEKTNNFNKSQMFFKKSDINYEEKYYFQAQEIYIKYFNGTKSIFELNIPLSGCRMVKDMIDLNMIDETIFVHVLEDITINLNDTYYRFIQTDEYKIYSTMNKIEKELMEKEKDHDNFIMKKIKEKKLQKLKAEEIKKYSTKKMKLEEINQKKMELRNEIELMDVPRERKKSTIQIAVEKILKIDNPKENLESERKKSIQMKLDTLKDIKYVDN